MMCDFSVSHDGILHILERLRRFNLGSWYRAKKQETSTGRMLSGRNTNDPTLLDRTPSPGTMIEEMVKFMRFWLVLIRWTCRMASRAARSWSASRRTPNWGKGQRFEINTRSSRTSK